MLVAADTDKSNSVVFVMGALSSGGSAQTPVSSDSRIWSSSAVWGSNTDDSAEQPDPNGLIRNSKSKLTSQVKSSHANADVAREQI